MRKLSGLFVLIFLYSVLSSQTLYDYPDQLNYSHFPVSATDSITNTFHTNGSWFGIGLPDDSNPYRWGKIAGPYSTYMNKWIGKSLIQFNFGIAGIGKIQFESAKDHKIVQYPGMLYQKYIYESYFLEQKVIFISGRSCLMQVDAINTSEISIPMSLMIKGSAYEEIGDSEQFTDGWMYKIDGESKIFWLLRFRLDDEMNLTFNPDNYEFSFKEPQMVLPGDTLRLVMIMSQYFEGDSKQDVMLVSEALNYPSRYFERNEKLWRFLISNIIVEKEELQEITMKSLQTMYLNLRSFIPGIRNYFFVERTGQDEVYINTDEAWFYTSSLIRYDTRLAINSLASNISNLNVDSSLNKIIPILNCRDSSQILNEKPMAAWTAWNIFSVSPDVDLMTTIYPMLTAYHKYWYLNHDINNNRWCEDQFGIERPDINALLFSEKYCLKKIAEVIGYEEDAEMYQRQMDTIKMEFNAYFFNTEMMTFVSYDLKDNSVIPASEAIAYCMWSGLAAFDVADYYATIIQENIDNGYFKNIFESGKFDIAYYYFLISGLRLYKYEKQSVEISDVLLSQILKDAKNNPLPSYGYNGMVNDNSTLTAAILILLLNY